MTYIIKGPMGLDNYRLHATKTYMLYEMLKKGNNFTV